jgi:hypothetical protein
MRPPACLQNGMNQSEQKAVLAAFRNSEFSVLVATCIGEEGLDIPEVGGAEPAGQSAHGQAACTARCTDGAHVISTMLTRRHSRSHRSCGNAERRCRIMITGMKQCSERMLLHHPALQVDLIICYDASASPTRNIQRMGRTGRHRQGRVVYILAKGQELEQYKRGQDKARMLQNQLRHADRWVLRSGPASCWLQVCTLHMYLAVGINSGALPVPTRGGGCS